MIIFLYSITAHQNAELERRVHSEENAPKTPRLISAKDWEILTVAINLTENRHNRNAINIHFKNFFLVFRAVLQKNCA